MTPRALVVDDEPQMLSIVSFALQTQGFECLSVANTARAWEHLAAARPSTSILARGKPSPHIAAPCSQALPRFHSPS